jgi:hypothetical protein
VLWCVCVCALVWVQLVSLPTCQPPVQWCNSTQLNTTRTTHPATLCPPDTPGPPPTHTHRTAPHSYNVAYFPKIYEAAGYPQLIQAAGSKGRPYDAPVRWLMYQVCVCV